MKENEKSANGISGGAIIKCWQNGKMSKITITSKNNGGIEISAKAVSIKIAAWHHRRK